MTPGQAEHAEGELRLARQALGAASQLLGTGALEDSTSRLYYAVFHAARAALTVHGLYSRTHSGLIHLFQETHGPAPILDRMFKLRAAADYEHEKFDATAESLERRIEEATAFVARCEEIVTEAVRNGPDEPDPPPDL